MSTEYRVIWKRTDCAPRRKRYVRRAAAERFMEILGPEPWKAFGHDPDDYFCCSGSECGCGGVTIREDSDARRADYPAIEFVRLEQRTVGEWVATPRRLLPDRHELYPSCTCVDVEIGSHANSVAVHLPAHMDNYREARMDLGLSPLVAMDRCIVAEIRHLWSLGISTTGSCCGHGKMPGVINVFPADIARMRELGYEVAPNSSRPGDEDTFYARGGVA